LEDEPSGFPYVIYSNVSNVHDLLEKVFIYLSTMANSTLIILFSEMLKISKIISSKSKNIVKENSEYLRIFHFSK
jgi:hypothetical protein